MSDDSAPQTEPHQPVVNAPLVAVVLTLALPVLYFFQLRLPDEGFDLAFSPARLQGGDPQGLISSIFLHGSWAHVLMNAIGLLAFGAPVARVMKGAAGAAGFVAFFIICGVVGALGYAAMNLGSPIPMVGASGGVFGLIGGSLRMATPHGPILPLNHPAVLSRAAMWAALSVVVGLMGLGATGGRVAWEAHLFSLVAGVLLVGPAAWLFGDRRSDLIRSPD